MDDCALPNGSILFLSDARGVYIPRDFATSIVRSAVTGVSDDTWATLESGPDAAWYWDAWTEVLDRAIVTDRSTGVTYAVYQDGDCWLVPCDARGCWLAAEDMQEEG